MQSYIVYLGGHSHDEELNLAALDQRVVDSHHELLSSILGRSAYICICLCLCQCVCIKLINL